DAREPRRAAPLRRALDRDPQVARRGRSAGLRVARALPRAPRPRVPAHARRPAARARRPRLRRGARAARYTPAAWPRIGGATVSTGWTRDGDGAPRSQALAKPLGKTQVRLLNSHWLPNN